MSVHETQRTLALSALSARPPVRPANRFWYKVVKFWYKVVNHTILWSLTPPKMTTLSQY